MVVCLCFLLAFFPAALSRSLGPFCALNLSCRLALAKGNFSLNLEVLQELHAHMHTRSRGSQQLPGDNNNGFYQLQE